MPHARSRTPSGCSHSSAEYTNVCSASAKRKARELRAQMARSNASDDTSPAATAARKHGRERDESESESDLGISDDQSEDSDGTRMRKSEARASHAKKQIRKRYRRLQEAADGE